MKPSIQDGFNQEADRLQKEYDELELAALKRHEFSGLKEDVTTGYTHPWTADGLTDDEADKLLAQIIEQTRPKKEKEFEPPLDPGIERAVKILREAGIETYESCEGGLGHSYKEPAVRFHGQRAEGFRALAVALDHNLPVSEIRRLWRIEDGEPVGPTWEMTFHKKLNEEEGTTATIILVAPVARRGTMTEEQPTYQTEQDPELKVRLNKLAAWELMDKLMEGFKSGQDIFTVNLVGRVLEVNGFPVTDIKTENPFPPTPYWG